MNTSFRIRESLEVLFSKKKISDKALSLKKKIYITLIFFLFSSAVVAIIFLIIFLVEGQRVKVMI